MTSRGSNVGVANCTGGRLNVKGGRGAPLSGMTSCGANVGLGNWLICGSWAIEDNVIGGANVGTSMGVPTLGAGVGETMDVARRLRSGCADSSSRSTHG